MKNEIIKSIIGELTNESNEKILGLLMEKAKSDAKVRTQINARFLQQWFSEEELNHAHILVHGRHIIQSGIWHVFGNTSITVSGEADVCFYERSVAGVKAGKATFFDLSAGGVQGNAQAQVYDYARVRLHEFASGAFHGYAYGEVHGMCQAIADENALLRIWGKASAHAAGNAILIQTGKTVCTYADASNGHLHGEACADASNNARLKLNNRASAELRDDANAEVYDNAHAKTRGKSIAIAHDSASIDAAGFSVVHIYQHSSAVASENAFITLHDYTFTVASGHVLLKLFGNSSAKATEEVKATLAGNNVLEISSGNVNYILQRNTAEGSASRSVLELGLHGNSGQVNILK